MGSANGPAPRPARDESESGLESSSPSASSSSAQSSDSPSISIFGGIFYGVLSVIAGWVGVVALFISRLPSRVDLQNVIGDEYVVELFAWLFFNAHGYDDFTVDIVQKSTTQSASSPPLNYITRLSVGNALHFHLIPAVLLFFCGLLLARKRSTPISGFVAGASVAIGYAPILIGGSFFFTVSEAGMSVGPELQSTVLIAGLIYPVGIGGLAGLLSGSA